MRWFKHMTDSSRDEFTSGLIGRFGLEGYARWWLLLEAVGSQMKKGSDRCSVSYPWSEWERILRGRRFKLRSYLVAIQLQSKIKLVENGNELEIKIPNLLKIRDEYSKKSGQTPDTNPDNVRTKDTETENKGEDTPSLPPPKKSTGLPDPFPLTAKMREWAAERAAPVDIEFETEQFLDHHRAKGSLFKDWRAAWRTWMRNAPKWSRKENHPPPRIAANGQGKAHTPVDEDSSSHDRIEQMVPIAKAVEPRLIGLSRLDFATQRNEQAQILCEKQGVDYDARVYMAAVEVLGRMEVTDG